MRRPSSHPWLEMIRLETESGSRENLTRERTREDDKSLRSVPSWPEEARPLKTHTWVSNLYLLGDIILILLPLYFIGIGIAVVLLNKTRTEDNALGRLVENAIKLGPTIFPIVFAAITGRSMKMMARFFAERGAKLSTLELLMASQSVWGTVESQFLIQRVTLVGIHLLFLWALSPIGGQASLRILEKNNQYASNSTKLRYMTTGPAAIMWGLTSTFGGNGQFGDIDSLFAAALLAPQNIKTGPQDPWGNIKIPTLTGIPAEKIGVGGWISVPENMSAPESYSSLVGLPIVGRPLDLASRFNIEATYLSVTCEPFTQTEIDGSWGASDTTNYSKLEELAPGWVWQNKSADNDPFRSTTFFLDTDRPAVSGRPLTPEERILAARWNGFIGFYNGSRNFTHNSDRSERKLQYVSLRSRNSEIEKIGLNIGSCNISQQHVESYVHCTEETCRVEQIRESQSDKRPSAFTGFEHPNIMIQMAKNFPRAFPATERYMLNTSAFPFPKVMGSGEQIESHVDLSSIPSNVFSMRLSLLLNTYYQLATQPNGYFGSLPNDLSLYGPDTAPANDIDAYLPSNLSATEHPFDDWWSEFERRVYTEDKIPFVGATTKADILARHEIYVCNFVWLALLLWTCTVMFVVGVVALILKRKTLGPELFGFVTSMTYENPYMRLPSGGSVLDAMERARILRDVKVSVRDVRGDEPIGHVALAAGVPSRKLERGRLYH